MTQQVTPPPAGYPYPPMPPGPAGMSWGGPPPAPGFGDFPPPPPVRKRSAGKVIGIVVGVFVATVVGIFVLVMAFGTVTVTDDQVEQQIAQQFGLTPSQVSCPSSLEGDVGEQMTCTASEGGVQTPVLVEVTGVDGTTVNFTMTPQ
jgi:hypothetical protein